MPTFEIPYGHEKAFLNLPENVHVDWIEPVYVAPAPDPLAVVRAALEQPVDGIPLDHYRGSKSVVIAINDKTRPVPHEHLLPPLLEKLHTLGIPASAISFVIATGTHQPMPADEFPRILPPEIYQNFVVFSHDCDDSQNLVELGTTKRGTRVLANRRFLEADLRIVVGNIEPHHFAGFSGGYKSAAIGVTSRETITHNHTMLTEPGAEIAEYEHNPLRQDIEDIGDLLKVQFALNAILNGEKAIVRAVSGHPRAVMQAGIPISREVCQVPVSGGKFDIVVASVGGAPKDINFYQSQKGLTHASLLVRDGGVIILAAKCPELSGSRSYEEFMQGLHSTQEVFERFRALGFHVGPHKAFQVARLAERAGIILVSEMPNDLTTRLLMTPAASLDEAFSLACDRLSSDRLSGARLSPTPLEKLRIAIVPRATNTIPVA